MTVDKFQKLSEFFNVPSCLFIEGETPAIISSYTLPAASEIEESLLSSTFLQLLKSTFHEELEKYLATNSNAKF